MHFQRLGFDHRDVDFNGGGCGTEDIRVIAQTCPTPEPASLAALGIGAAGLMRLRRKRA